MQLRKESLKKNQVRTGFEPLTSAIPVQRLTNYANKPTGSRLLNWFVINAWKDDDEIMTAMIFLQIIDKGNETKLTMGPAPLRPEVLIPLPPPRPRQEKAMRFHFHFTIIVKLADLPTTVQLLLCESSLLRIPWPDLKDHFIQSVISYKSLFHEGLLLGSFHLNSHTLGFHPA